VPGYSDSTATVALEIARDGAMIRAIPLGTQKGKRVVGLPMKVPERVKRSSGDSANFLCDAAEYILGAQVTDKRRASRRHALCVALHREILSNCPDDGAQAVLAFFERWNPSGYPNDPRLNHVREILAAGGNIVFRLENDGVFVHERPAVIKAWDAYRASQSSASAVGQCLVTGEYGPIARLHKSISGIRGAQPTGASLVSFNFQAAESYGKEQGANSPVGERAAFAYGTALNWLTARERHRVVAGDTTIVFWAERAGPEEDLLLDLLGMAIGRDNGPGDSDAQEQASISNDEASAQEIRSVLKHVVQGRPLKLDAVDLHESVRFYILGLSPNKARASVRFWHVGTFGSTVENLRTHFQDMAIVHEENETPPGVGRLLMETAPAGSRKAENVAKVLTGSLMQSILNGTAYPRAIYAAIIGRIRADSNDPNRPRLERKVTYTRAAFIKAYLKRKARIVGNTSSEEVLTEMLNPDNKSPGYLLGRLFALLEKAQQDAYPDIKSTIKDRYYASASATPSTVFPVLIRLAQHHIAKSEYGGYVDKLIQDVMDDIEMFPTHLDLDEQGLFALGYYQQKNALYRPAETKEKGGE